MADWLDPLGMRRFTDAMSTGAAQALVGRSVRLDQRNIEARVAAVDRAAPANALSAMLSAHIGLWRRLDVTFAEVRIDGQTVDRVRVDASDIRAVEALPQRVQAKDLAIEVEFTPAEVQSWLATIVPPDVVVRVDERRLLARFPGLARFGEVELEPRWSGRTVGVDVQRAWVRGRRVGLPERFRRSHERELTWLPPTTEIQEVGFDDLGGLVVTGSIRDYVVELDVPRLLADLTARSTAGAIDILLGS
ncbi:MAG: hypothetical protein AAGA90_14535 [Actinomycetota bacterium]